MNNSTHKTTSPKAPATSKGSKALRVPRRLRELLHCEELEVYNSNREVDPWRGQIMQIGWDYCV